MRRSLVLTTESARHPFRARLPQYPRAEAMAVPTRPTWQLTRDDVQGFASAYFACFAAVLVFLS